MSLENLMSDIPRIVQALHIKSTGGMFMASKLKVAAIFGAILLFSIAGEAGWIPGVDVVSGSFFF